MAGNDKTPICKQTHVSEGVDDFSTHFSYKQQTQTVSEKLGSSTRSRPRSTLKQLSPLVKEKIYSDDSPDISKSSKIQRKKRGSLKMNKSSKQRVSPYATRSLSPFSVLRNGKRINDLKALIKRKYKKRTNIEDRDDMKSVVVEDSKKSYKFPSPELLPRKLRKKCVPEEPSVCNNSTSLESVITAPNVKDGYFSNQKGTVEDITADSLSNGSQVKQEDEENFNNTESSIEEVFSLPVDNDPTDKSSSFNVLSDEHSKTDLMISCKDDLVSNKEIENSCDMVFDLSKCGDCLQHMIDGAKVEDNIKELTETSGAFSERLFLSDSPRSFENVSGNFSDENGVSKSDFEMDRCTFDNCSGILSTENSESSVLRCSSSEGNFHNTISLPPYDTEEESGSANLTCDSISVPDAEESMNELMNDIRSVNEHAKQVRLIDLTYDSDKIDTTNNLERIKKTELLSDKVDVSSKDQVVEDSSVYVVAEGNAVIEPAKIVADHAVLDILEAREKCNYNKNSSNSNEFFQESVKKPLATDKEPADINHSNTSSGSIESDNCDIISKENETYTKNSVENSKDSPKCINGEEGFCLQLSIRSSLASIIVKKGLLPLPESETTSTSKEKEPENNEPSDKEMPDSDSSVTTLDKCYETEEFLRDRSLIVHPEKSRHIDHENELVENFELGEEVGNTELNNCQVSEPTIIVDRTLEENCRENYNSTSICTSENFHINGMSTTVSIDKGIINQKENEDLTNSLTLENKENGSSSEGVVNVEEDSAEQLAIKETILNALGLQSSRAASLAKSTIRQGLPPIPSRTSGTLKTIIKVPRMADKRRTRNPLKLVLKSDKAALEKEKEGPLYDKRSVAEKESYLSRQSESLGQQTTEDPLAYRIFNESCISTGEPWGTHISKQKSKSHGNSRKFSTSDPLPHLDLNNLHFSRSSINGLSTSSSLDCQSKSSQELDQNISSDGSSNSQQGSSEGSGEASLVIPEKSASFSIHPERLCHDVCCYCFGKFGSLDTPMHLAQMKGEEKRRTALALEAHLSPDSCLCDACYRYLDRKASCPSYQPYRRQSGVSGGILTKPQVCCVRGCSLPAHHLVRRKWLTRLRRTISKLLPLELTPVPSHQQQPLHAPLCSRHFYCLEYYSMCGICKRKLSRNNMHPVGREVHALNSVLVDDSIPVTLTGKIFLCKMCRYYSGIRLKYRDKSMLSSGHKTFFDGYRKRIWHYLGIHTLDNSEISVPMEIPKKRKKSKSTEGDSSKNSEQGKQPKNMEGVSSQPAEIISESNSETSASKPGGSAMPTKIRFKLGNVSIGQLDNVDLNKKDSKGHISQTVTQSGSRSKSESAKPKKKSTADSAMKNSCFPGVEQLGLNASFVFHGDNGDNKNKEWEKCTTTIQFDSKTKKLWQNLYYPYGNFSSFIRHLVIMERNWRNGDLVLAPNASSQAVNYVNSVQNRIAAYEGNLPRQSTKPTSSKPISSKPVAVPQKPTKEPPILPSTTVSRINLTSSQFPQCSRTLTTPVTAQLIPVNSATNFLPISCGPSQFISIGSTSSFIQIGGTTGLVHQINGPYPCVQFNQQIVPEKNLVQKVEEISGQELPTVSVPSSSSTNFDPHISNVRSLADDVGNSNCWEQHPDRQLSTGENDIASNTYDIGKPEEQQMQSIVPVASLAVVGVPPVEIHENCTYSDEAGGNQMNGKSVETQGSLFKTV